MEFDPAARPLHSGHPLWGRSRRSTSVRRPPARTPSPGRCWSGTRGVHRAGEAEPPPRRSVEGPTYARRVLADSGSMEPSGTVTFSALASTSGKGRPRCSCERPDPAGRRCRRRTHPDGRLDSRHRRHRVVDRLQLLGGLTRRARPRGSLLSASVGAALGILIIVMKVLACTDVVLPPQPWSPAWRCVGCSSACPPDVEHRPVDGWVTGGQTLRGLRRPGRRRVRR
jgi:hypothetical protein